jgi:hypothetical protein
MRPRKSGVIPLPSGDRLVISQDYDKAIIVLKNSDIVLRARNKTQMRKLLQLATGLSIN